MSGDHETAGDGHVHEDEQLEGPPSEDVADAIWRTDNVELITVGVDIGSSTSHLMFAHIHLRRQSSTYSTRFVVVSRRALHRSPILLTPYRADGLIDTDALRAFIEQAYRAAGYSRDQVDAGAVILTGVALERANARGIAELFAREGGKFVCASAGHNLEALLAAHGSGAVDLSRAGGAVLNIDVGGGTTKLALAEDGQVVATMAIAAGARLIEFDDAGLVRRIEPAGAELARELKIDLALGSPLAAAARTRLGDALADRVIAAANGGAGEGWTLTGQLPAGARPARVVFSGGVGELLAKPHHAGFNDLGLELAAALDARIARLPAPVHASTERIRATVIGASQFTVQLSGNTVHVSDAAMLPLHNVPVVSARSGGGTVTAAALRQTIERGAERLDLHMRDQAIAVAIDWAGEPSYANLRALAQGVADAHRAAPRRDAPVIIALQSDIGASLGTILVEELGMRGGVIAVDGLELADLDYIDLGEAIRPANVIPVVVKSLVFPDAASVRAPEIRAEVGT